MVPPHLFSSRSTENTQAIPHTPTRTPTREPRAGQRVHFQPCVLITVVVANAVEDLYRVSRSRRGPSLQYGA